MGLLGPAMPDRLPPPATPPLPLLWATAITTNLTGKAGQTNLNLKLAKKNLTGKAGQTTNLS